MSNHSVGGANVSRDQHDSVGFLKSQLSQNGSLLVSNNVVERFTDPRIATEQEVERSLSNSS